MNLRIGALELFIAFYSCIIIICSQGDGTHMLTFSIKFAVAFNLIVTLRKLYHLESSSPGVKWHGFGKLYSDFEDVGGAFRPVCCTPLCGSCALSTPQMNGCPSFSPLKGCSRSLKCARCCSGRPWAWKGILLTLELHGDSLSICLSEMEEKWPCYRHCYFPLLPTPMGWKIHQKTCCLGFFFFLSSL